LSLICPKCGSRAVGRIGQNQYYCWDCSIEFVPTKDGFRMYRLEEDGSAVLDSEETNSRPATLAGRSGSSLKGRLKEPIS